MYTEGVCQKPVYNPNSDWWQRNLRSRRPKQRQ